MKKAVGAILASLVGAGLVLGMSATQTERATRGRNEYRAFCRTCHGEAAAGDGVLATALTVRPADLTKISSRNAKKEFPRDAVYKAIAETGKLKGKGCDDMPHWAEAFARSRDGGSPERVRETILDLVAYLESVQK